jgi:ABC-type transporter Mla subunit MlaD
MDQQLIAFLDERFRETLQQIAGLRTEIDQRFERVDQRFEEAAETARHTVVLVEGLRHEVQLVAEGYMGLNEKLASYQSGIDVRFSQVQASIEPYYRDLNNRVAILEERAERQRGDVMDAIRNLVLKFRQEAQEGG